MLSKLRLTYKLPDVQDCTYKQIKKNEIFLAGSLMFTVILAGEQGLWGWVNKGRLSGVF